MEDRDRKRAGAARRARPAPATTPKVTLATLLAELPNPEWRLAASHLRALAALEPADLTRVATGWATLPTPRRLEVVRITSEIAEDNVDLDFTPFFASCLGDPDPGVRQETISALWYEHAWSVGATFLTLLDADPAPAVRAAAAGALGKFVSDGETAQRRPRWLPRVVDALARHASDRAERPEVRRLALESLAYAPDDRVPALIQEQFDTPSLEARTTAIRAMGRTCDAFWVDTITAEMHSPHPALRFEAALAAAEFADPSLALALVALTQDPDSEVQLAAIEALGECGGPVARQTLRELAASGAGEIRETATAALAQAKETDDPLSFGDLRPGHTP